MKLFCYLQHGSQPQLGAQHGLLQEEIGMFCTRSFSQKCLLGITTHFVGPQADDAHSPIAVGHTGAAPPVTQGQEV